jgi:sporulation protein YlmC with PRC-barrel domain
MAQNANSNVDLMIKTDTGVYPIKKLALLSAAVLVAGATASMAAGEMMTNVPPGSLTVTDWYKQSVYDPSNRKIGEVMDVLVSRDGRIDALIVGVGGFLGAGEKDIAVSFNSVQKTVKDNKIYLTMSATKDALKTAPGFKYDKQETTWVPDTAGNVSQ